MIAQLIGIIIASLIIEAIINESLKAIQLKRRSQKGANFEQMQRDYNRTETQPVTKAYELVEDAEYIELDKVPERVNCMEWGVSGSETELIIVDNKRVK